MCDPIIYYSPIERQGRYESKSEVTLKIDSNKVKSNILYCRLDTDVIGEDEFLNLCKKENILFFKYPSGDYRLVTHSGINEDDIKLTLSTFEKILS